MTITINGTDVSAYTTKYGKIITPRKIQGPNAGKDALGNNINDPIATAYDLTITLMPATPNEVYMWAEIAKNETVEVHYYCTPKKEWVTVLMEPALSVIPLSLVNGSDEIYNGMQLQLTEVIEDA